MALSRREVVRSALALSATAILPDSVQAEERAELGSRTMAGRSAPLKALVSLEDFEHAARERIDPVAWEYIDSGAADEITLRWNREAFRTIRLAPRQLRDVAQLDLGVRLVGHSLAHPILLAPTAAHRLAHPDGEMATARGARLADAGMVLSSYSTTAVERVATEHPPLLWFQLYVQDRAFTVEQIRRAAAARCTAIVVTIDTPVSGPRNRQARSGFDFPADLPHISKDRGNHPLTWKDLEWIRAASSLPIFLKGILNPADVEQSIAAGAAGIMVSNHGGRNLDTAVATIDALPRIVEAAAGRIPVLVDGGIRRGTDVLKALALGATAIMIGRPYVHGLAVNGAAGVEAVVAILRQELEMAMALCGCRSVSSVDRSILA